VPCASWHKRASLPGDRLETGTRKLSGLPVRLVQIACGVLLAVKLAHWSLSGVFMDEAYYWMWGQHPSLSYYDHPPLNAWILGLSSAVLGWSKLALRAPVVLTFAADVLALYLIARRIGGDWQSHFWLTLLLFLATPVFSMVTNYALPDHALLAALLLSIAFLFRFFSDRSDATEGRSADLFMGALFLGLAGLAKYNAVFLGAGVVLFVLLYDRPLLRQLRIYLAGAVTLALQLPVIVWNASFRFASYGFILEGRHDGLAASLDGLPPLALGVFIFVSPILFWPIAKFLLPGSNNIPGSGFARTSFLLSSAAITALAFTTLTLFHWNLVAYAAMLPFLATYMRPLWLVPIQTAWGLFFAIMILVVHTSSPEIAIKGWRDESAAWSQDWSPVAEALAEARAANQIGFVAAADYTTASLLGFAAKDREVVSLSSRRDQYDFWFDPEKHRGQSAILYGDSYRPITSSIRRQFEQIEEIVTMPVIAGGSTVNRQSLYLARGFNPRG
jgi:4-amino-4-deoxy-L-arabinose transferase-like glycosyltransferase